MTEASSGRVSRTRTGRRATLHVSQWLAIISGALLVSGLVFIVLYASSTSGAHLRYAGVGLLTALAAFVTGCLFGFLFGIPRAVSSGALRHASAQPTTVTDTKTDTTQTQTTTVPAVVAAEVGLGGHPGPTDAAPQQAVPAAVATPVPEVEATPAGPTPVPLNFEPSSNLAEISDWLTKLLLGAGLVSLTKLGTPISSLIDGVARGLVSDPNTTGGAAQALAGAVLILYSVLGFLDGYVVTTLWYGRRMNKL